VKNILLLALTSILLVFNCNKFHVVVFSENIFAWNFIHLFAELSFEQTVSTKYIFLFKKLKIKMKNGSLDSLYSIYKSGLWVQEKLSAEILRRFCIDLGETFNIVYIIFKRKSGARHENWSDAHHRLGWHTMNFIKIIKFHERKYLISLFVSAYAN